MSTSSGPGPACGYQLLDLGAVPDWSTLEVSGPVTMLDGMGRPWFEYRASVQSRAAFAPDRRA